MGLLYGRARRLNTKNGGFRPGQCWDGFGGIKEKLVKDLQFHRHESGALIPLRAHRIKSPRKEGESQT
jgi:hypothetical protein